LISSFVRSRATVKNRAESRARNRFSVFI
jgi:hypothetical protein